MFPHTVETSRTLAIEARGTSDVGFRSRAVTTVTTYTSRELRTLCVALWAFRQHTTDSLTLTVPDVLGTKLRGSRMVRGAGE